MFTQFDIGRNNDDEFWMETVMAQSVEAVIISGPRRGEIIQLVDETVPEFSEAELKQLNAGLDEVINAIDRLSSEFRAGTKALTRKDTTS